MKTLDQLWQESGCKSGLKVRRIDWREGRYFVILGKTPKDIFLGYTQDDSNDSWVGNAIDWTLYQEPKPKYYEWLVYIEGQVPFTSGVIMTEEQAKHRYTEMTKIKKLREIDVEFESCI